MILIQFVVGILISIFAEYLLKNIITSTSETTFVLLFAIFFLVGLAVTFICVPRKMLFNFFASAFLGYVFSISYFALIGSVLTLDKTFLLLFYFVILYIYVLGVTA